MSTKEMLQAQKYYVGQDDYSQSFHDTNSAYTRAHVLRRVSRHQP